MDVTGQDQDQDDDVRLVPVFVTTAIRVSGGERTPGVVHVPPGEASRIVAGRHGVLGITPPRGYSDGGMPPAYAAMLPRDG
jgi:hypothetical protein